MPVTSEASLCRDACEAGHGPAGIGACCRFYLVAPPIPWVNIGDLNNPLIV
jgi:hypothetical protein